MTTPASQTCVECGESLYLFQPVCTNCETGHEWEYRAACHDCGETVDYIDEECPHCGTELSVWRALEADAFEGDEQHSIWKDAVPRPLEAGYKLHLGSIHGQWADYRRPVPDGGEFHVRVYAKRYELHHDDVSAIDTPGRHLLRHGAPAATASGIDVVRRVGSTLLDSGRVVVRAPYELLSGGKNNEEQTSD